MIETLILIMVIVITLLLGRYALQEGMKLEEKKNNKKYKNYEQNKRNNR